MAMRLEQQVQSSNCRSGSHVNRMTRVALQLLKSALSLQGDKSDDNQRFFPCHMRFTDEPVRNDFITIYEANQLNFRPRSVSFTVSTHGSSQCRAGEWSEEMLTRRLFSGK